jgi:hypothetical protein
MMLTPVHTIASPVGTFPMRGSCGQLLVYEMVLPGRVVAAAHAVQKKKALSRRSRSGSSSVPRGIAYAVRP